MLAFKDLSIAKKINVVFGIILFSIIVIIDIKTIIKVNEEMNHNFAHLKKYVLLDNPSSGFGPIEKNIYRPIFCGNLLAK